jgi:hypothetical protein
VEVVLQAALDETVLDGDGSDPPPVRPVRVADADDRRVAGAHALRFLPPG